MSVDVSVLICAHNEQKYIRQSIESVLQESTISIQVVIVDDMSTDDTSQIIADMAETDSRIILVTRVHKEELQDVNRGLYYYEETGYGGQTDASNLGLKFCEGKYIARLDADDVCFPSRFRKQFEYMEAHPDVDFLGSSAKRIDTNGVVFGEYHNKPLGHDEIVDHILTFKPYAAHSSWFVKKDLYDKLNGYNMEGYRAEDYDFMLRAIELGGVKFAFISEPLIYLRMQDNRLSSVPSALTTCHAIEALVRHNVRNKGMKVTESLANEIRKNINQEIERKGMLSMILAYRSLTNAYINLKTWKLLKSARYLLGTLKNSPTILFNYRSLSKCKWEIAQAVSKEIMS